MRALLFRAVLPLIAKNEEFNPLYKYYTTRDKNPLKKMQSIIALCHKLIRVMYKIMASKAKYNGEKIIADIKQNNLLEVS